MSPAEIRKISEEQSKQKRPAPEAQSEELDSSDVENSLETDLKLSEAADDDTSSFNLATDSTGNEITSQSDSTSNTGLDELEITGKDGLVDSLENIADKTVETFKKLSSEAKTASKKLQPDLKEAMRALGVEFSRGTDSDSGEPFTQSKFNGDNGVIAKIYDSGKVEMAINGSKLTFPSTYPDSGTVTYTGSDGNSRPAISDEIDQDVLQFSGTDFTGRQKADGRLIIEFDKPPEDGANELTLFPRNQDGLKWQRHIPENGNLPESSVFSFEDGSLKVEFPAKSLDGFKSAVISENGQLNEIERVEQPDPDELTKIETEQNISLAIDTTGQKQGTDQNIAELSLKHQTEAITEHGSLLPEPQQSEFLADIKKFNQRDDLTDTQKAETLYQANRMLEAGINEIKPPLGKEDFTRTALDFMKGAAYPPDTNQGFHNTCATTGTRESLLEENPALAGKIAANILIDGTFTAPDGTKVRVDRESLNDGRESILSAHDRELSDELGFRGQFGRAIDMALTNYAHTKNFIDSYQSENSGASIDSAYEQIKEPFYKQIKPVDNNDTGERLNLAGQPEARHSMMTPDMVENTSKVFLGMSNVASNRIVDTDSSIAHGFTSESQMKDLLSRQEDVERPVQLLVNFDHPAIHPDKAQDQSNVDGDRWHYVMARDIQEIGGEDYVRVSGFHGDSSDRWIAASDIYNSTLRSNDHTGITHPIYKDNEGSPDLSSVLGEPGQITARQTTQTREPSDTLVAGSTYRLERSRTTAYSGNEDPHYGERHQAINGQPFREGNPDMHGQPGFEGDPAMAGQPWFDGDAPPGMEKRIVIDNGEGLDPRVANTNQYPFAQWHAESRPMGIDPRNEDVWQDTRRHLLWASLAQTPAISFNPDNSQSYRRAQTLLGRDFQGVFSTDPEPSPRHSINSFIARQYFDAKDRGDSERANLALNMLRMEVKSERNNSAHSVLQSLEFVDRVMDLDSAVKDGDLSAQQRALTRLAALENKFDGAKNFLDGYASRGENPDFDTIEQVRMARLKAKGGDAAIAEEAQRMIEDGLSGNPLDIESLRIARETIDGGDLRDGIDNATAFMATSRGAKELFKTINDPDKFETSLKEMLNLAEENPHTRKMLKDIGVENEEDVRVLVDKLRNPKENARELGQLVSKLSYHARGADDLSSSMRQESKVKTPSDILKEFPNPEMVEKAREEIQKWADQNFNDADNVLEQFLRRPGAPAPEGSRESRQEDNLSPAEKRTLAISRLEELADERLRVLARDQFRDVANWMKGTNHALNITEAEPTQDTAKTMLSELEKLENLNTRSSNETVRLIEEKLKAQGTSLEEVKKQLQTENPSLEEKTRIEETQKLLSDTVKSVVDDQMNDYRIMRVVRHLDENSSHKDHTRALEELKEEVKAGNYKAIDWYQWSVSQEAVTDIREAGTDTERINAAVKRLTDSATGANGGERNNFSRFALATLLAGTADQNTMNGLIGNGSANLDNKPMFLARMDALKKENPAGWREVQGEIIETLASEYGNSSAPLAPGELTALAVAHSQLATETSNEGADGESAKQLLDQSERILKNLVTQTRSETRLEDGRLKTFEVPSENSTSTMRGLNEAITLGAPGSESLADIVIAGGDNPVFAEHYRDYSRMVIYGDKASLRILGAVAGGTPDARGLTQKAARRLSLAGSNPEISGDVMDSLVHAYNTHGDRAMLLETLGEIAGKNESIPDNVRQAIYNGLEGRTKEERRSAARGIMNYAESWNDGDVDEVLKNLSPEMLTELERSSDRIPPEYQQKILETMFARLEADKIKELSQSERVLSLKTISALSRHLTPGQVEKLARFGDGSETSDPKYHDSDGKNWMLDPPTLSEENANELQEQAGKIVLRALSAERPDTVSTAFDVFTKVRFPELQDKALRDGLVKYIKGQSMDGIPIGMLKQIHKMVYDTGIPMPVAGLMQDFGVEGNDSVLRQRANDAIEHYERDDKTGERVIRDVANRVALWNSLDRKLREEVLKEITDSDTIDPTLLRDVDPRQIGGKLTNGTLGESGDPLAFLMDPEGRIPPEQGKTLEQIVKQKSWDTDRQVSVKEAEMQSLLKERKETLDKLVSETKEGPGFLRRAGSFVKYSSVISMALMDDPVAEWESMQAGLVVELPEIDQKIKDVGKELEPLQQREQLLDFSTNILQHEEFMNQGKVKEADLLALDMYTKYGVDTMQQLAPRVYGSLLHRQGDGVIGRSGLERLKDAGLIPFDQVIDYSPNPRDRFDDAISNLKLIDGNYEDSDWNAIRLNALRAIDQDEGMNALGDAAKVINENMGVFQQLFQAGEDGTKYETFVQDVRRRSVLLKEAIESVTPEQLAQAKEQLRELRKVRNGELTDADKRKLELLASVEKYMEGGKSLSDVERELTNLNQDIERRLKDAVPESDMLRRDALAMANGLLVTGKDASSLDSSIEALKAKSELSESETRQLQVLEQAREITAGGTTQSVKQQLDNLNTSIKSRLDNAIPETLLKRKTTLEASREFLSNNKSVDNVKEAIKELRESKITDPEALKAIDDRIKSLEGMIETVDPNSENHKSLMKLFENIESRDYNADTLGNWIKENGVVIAATMAAAAITVASMGTASPLAVILVTSAVALGASQLTKEGLYLVNHHMGDTGLGRYNERSYAGAFAAKMYPKWQEFVGNLGDKDQQENLQDFVKLLEESGQGYLKDVLGPMALEYGFNVAIGFATLGICQIGSQGIKGLAPSSLKNLLLSRPAQQLATNLDDAALVAGRSPAAQRFMNNWLGRFSREIATDAKFTVMQEGGTAITNAAAQQYVGKGNNWVSFAISAGLALAQSRRGRARFDGDLLRPGKGRETFVDPHFESQLINQMKRDGHRVVERAPGHYEITPYTAKAGDPPIIVRRNPDVPFDLPESQVVRDTNTDSRVSRLDQSTRWLGDSVSHLNQGRYGDAYQSARSPDGRPDNLTFTQEDVRIRAEDIINGTGLNTHIRQMQTAGDAIMTRDGNYRIVEPRTVVNLRDGVSVDLMNATKDSSGRLLTIDGKPLSDADQALMQQVMNSRNGKRIMAEHAMTMMEEMYHIKQYQNGGNPLSQTYKDFADAHPDQVPRSDENSRLNRSRDSLEQEFAAALYDANAHPDFIKNHFEGHYSSRKPLMDFVRRKAGLPPVADAPTSRRAATQAERTPISDDVEMNLSRDPDKSISDSMNDLGAAIRDADLDPIFLDDLNNAVGKLDDAAMGGDFVAEQIRYIDELTKLVKEGKLNSQQIDELAFRISHNINSPSSASNLDPFMRTLIRGDNAQANMQSFDKLIQTMPPPEQLAPVDGQIVFMGRNGWKVKTGVDGKPVMRDGNMVLIHDGEIRIKPQDAGKLKGRWEQVSKNSDGTVTMKQEGINLEAEARPDELLASLMAGDAGGSNTCTACVTAFLMNAARPGGISPSVSDGSVMTPRRLQNEKIGSVQADRQVGLNQLLGFVSEHAQMTPQAVQPKKLGVDVMAQVTPEVLAKAGPGLYVATSPAISTDTGSMSHTWVVSVDAAGNVRMLDVAHGKVRNPDGFRFETLHKLTGPAADRAMTNLDLTPPSSRRVQAPDSSTPVDGSPQNRTGRGDDTDISLRRTPEEFLDLSPAERASDLSARIADSPAELKPGLEALAKLAGEDKANHALIDELLRMDPNTIPDDLKGILNPEIIDIVGKDIFSSISQTTSTAAATRSSRTRQGDSQDSSNSRRDTTADTSKQQDIVDALDYLTSTRVQEQYPDLKYHDIDSYVKALEGKGINVTEFVGVGYESIAFELPNGNVMKITRTNELPTGEWNQDYGQRSFDAPIKGEVEILDVPGGEIAIYEQPFVEMGTVDTDSREWNLFQKQLKDSNHGFFDGDFAGDQVGIITDSNGRRRVVLIDYPSVREAETNLSSGDDGDFSLHRTPKTNIVDGFIEADIQQHNTRYKATQFVGVDGKIHSAESLAKVVPERQDGKFESGLFVIMDNATLTPPETVPKVKDLAEIPGTRDLYRDHDGSVWRVEDGKPPVFQDDLAIVYADRIHNPLADSVVATADKMKQLEAKNLSPDQFKEQLETLIDSAPELEFSAEMLTELNLRQRQYLNAFNDPVGSSDMNLISSNCKDCVAALYRSRHEGKIVRASDVTEIIGPDGKKIGHHSPDRIPEHDSSALERARQNQMDWLARAAGVQSPDRVFLEGLKNSSANEFAVVVELSTGVEHVFYGRKLPDGSMSYFDPQSGVRWSTSSVESAKPAYYPLTETSN